MLINNNQKQNKIAVIQVHTKERKTENFDFELFCSQLIGEKFLIAMKYRFIYL